jgi:hypothetical protein
MVSQTLRRLSFPLVLAAARLRTGRAQRGLVAIGVAVGVGLLAVVLAGSLAAQDRSLAQAIDQIPAVDRSVRAVWSGIPEQGSTPYRALERTARHTFAGLFHRKPFAVAVFAETELGPTAVNLGAIEGLRRWVRLTSGRMPRTCTPHRCEVVRVAGRGNTRGAKGLRLVVVGVGRLRSALPLGGLVSETTTRSKTPFLLASKVPPLAQSPVLSYDSRTYAWVLPVAQAGVHPWTTGSFVRSIVRAGSAVSATDSAFQVVAPQDELSAADETARVAGRRLFLLGGEAAALLLAFAVLAAARMRRDAWAAARRLTGFGATRTQIAVAAIAEAVVLAFLGALAGWIAGIGLGALVARRLGSPVGEVIGHSVLAPSGIGVTLGLAGAAAIVLFLALRARPVRVGRLSISALDVAAGAAVAGVVLALARGVADENSLATERGTGVVLLLLPGLIVFAGAVLAARIFVPSLRMLERFGRRGPVAARLAALSLARNPGHAAVTVAFLVVSLGLALFAATYRSTLVQGQKDQAAFTVPRDVILSEDLARLVSVVDAAPSSAYRRLGEAAPVVRLSGDVPGALSGAGLTVLGIPANAVPKLDGWRGDFSRSSLAGLGRRIAPRGAMGVRGPRLPSGARTLELPVSTRGDDLSLIAVFETTRGTFTSARLGTAHRGRPVVLRVPFPPGVAGGRLVALDPELPATGIHDSGNGPGTTVFVVSRGTAVLGTPRVAGRRLRVDYGHWTGANGMRPLGRSPNGGVRVQFVLTPDHDASFRPRVPTDGRSVPVVASPAVAATAGPGGLLGIEVGNQSLRARVVAEATRFPSVDGDFVLADRQTLATAMNAAVPGTATTNEIWLDARPGKGVGSLEAALRRPPFSALATSSRRNLEARLAAEPLARGSLLVLEAGALAALVLALAGLLLAVLTDLGDERGELLDLEAQGAAPVVLRRQVRLRAFFLAFFGLLGGLVIGAVLTRLVVRLVTLAASPSTDASLPAVPLQLFVDWPLAALALVALTAVAAALVAGPTWRTFR